MLVLLLALLVVVITLYILLLKNLFLTTGTRNSNWHKGKHMAAVCVWMPLQRNLQQINAKIIPKQYHYERQLLFKILNNSLYYV